MDNTFRFNDDATVTFDKRHAYYIDGMKLVDTMRAGGYDRMETTQRDDGSVTVRFGWREEGKAK